MKRREREPLEKVCVNLFEGDMHALQEASSSRWRWSSDTRTRSITHSESSTESG